MVKVSIIVPHYNQTKFIGKALASIKAQTFRDYEILVIDDASSEDIVKALPPFVRVTLDKRKENGGIGAVRQQGVGKCGGKYIAYLSADDEWVPEFLEETVKVADATGADVVYTDYFRMNETGEELSEFHEFHPISTADLKIHAWQRCCVNFSAILIRREVFNKVKFDTSMRFGEDYLWLLEALKEHKFVHIPKCLSKYRIHYAQGTNQYAREIPENDMKIRAIAKKFWGLK